MFKGVKFEVIESTNKGKGFKRYLFEKFEVIVMDENGYVNGTKLCQYFGKMYKNWVANALTKELFNEVSLSDKGILSIKVIGGLCDGIRGTYIHPLLLVGLMTWVNPMFLSYTSEVLFNESNSKGSWDHFFSLTKKKGKGKGKVEKEHQVRLNNELRGYIEVKTPVGFIDILTYDEIIEVKTYKHWKHAIGQIDCYGFYYPYHQKVIYLFNAFEVPKEMQEICDAKCIVVRLC